MLAFGKLHIRTIQLSFWGIFMQKVVKRHHMAYRRQRYVSTAPSTHGHRRQLTIFNARGQRPYPLLPAQQALLHAAFHSELKEIPPSSIFMGQEKVL